MSNLRLSALKAVFKKEITEILRDRRTLAVMILLPLILYPAILLIGSQVGMRIAQTQQEKVFSVAFAFPESEELEALVSDGFDDYRLTVHRPDDVPAALESGEIMAYTTRTVEHGQDLYTVYYRSSSQDSETASRRLWSVLEDYRSQLAREEIRGAGLDPDLVMESISFTLSDQAREEETAGRFLGMILPLILILGLVTGAMYPAIDVTSGEKERGTLETLLTLPLSNLELMGGKYLAVSLVAVLSGLLNFISLILVGVFMLSSLSAQAPEGTAPLQFDGAALIGPFLATLLTVIVFAFFVSALILCVTSLARSFKEAQNFMTPILLLFMFPAYLPMIPDIQLTPVMATVPVANIALLIRDVLLQNVQPGLMALVLASNLAYTLLAVAVLSKIYHSEKILFDEEGGLGLLQRRSDLIAGTPVSLSDGVIVYIIGVLMLIYAGTALQLRLGFWGVAGTQLLILGLPLLAALYLKAPFRDTFSLHLPCPRHLAGGVLLWAGTFIVVSLLSDTLVRFFPGSDLVVEELTAILSGQSLPVTLLVIAVLPAICEEVFFRGFLYSSLKRTFRPATTILLTGFLFGLYHIAPVRIIPTTVLGISMTLGLAWSGSLAIPVLMHLVNNTVAVVLTRYTQPIDRVLNAWAPDVGQTTATVLLAGAALLLLAAGKRLFKRPGTL